MATRESSAASRPAVLCIGGLDPSGGAGILADAEAVRAAGGRPLCAATAITVQTARGVRSFQPLPPRLLLAQVEALLEDERPLAIKLGMLCSPALVRSLATLLGRRMASPADGRRPKGVEHSKEEDGFAGRRAKTEGRGAFQGGGRLRRPTGEGRRAWSIPTDAERRWLIIDPVLAASGGTPLFRGPALAGYRPLLGLPALWTPNLPEIEALVGLHELRDPGQLLEAARSLRREGAAAVLLKGGHLPGPMASDLLLTARGAHWLRGSRLDRTARGTGCRFASALATRLALGDELLEAARFAKRLVRRHLEATTSLSRPGPARGSRSG